MGGRTGKLMEFRRGEKLQNGEYSHQKRGYLDHHPRGLRFIPGGAGMMNGMKS